MINKTLFEQGRDYNNVYFMRVDAKSHSRIVENNDADKVDQAFDRFEEVAYRAVDEAEKNNRCQYAEFWGWQGDGGLCIFYDDQESRARLTALSAGDVILQEVPHLNDTLQRVGVNGEIHVRVAVHRGNFRYKSDQRRGSIHSRELNFCCHLEKVVPQDTIAISEDIYQIMGDEQHKFFEAIEPFGEERVFFKSFRGEDEVQREWRENITPSLQSAIRLDSDVPVGEMGLIGVFSQRALTGLYAQLLSNARDCIWALGIGLGGFQRDHRQVLIQKAEEGVDIRLLAADPESKEVVVRLKDAELALPSWRDAESGLGDYNIRNVRDLTQMVVDVNRQLGTTAMGQQKRVMLRYYKAVPSVALLLVDSTLFLSPYLIHLPNLKTATFMVGGGGRLFDQFIDHFSHIWSSDQLSRDALTANLA